MIAVHLSSEVIILCKYHTQIVICEVIICVSGSEEITIFHCLQNSIPWRSYTLCFIASTQGHNCLFALIALLRCGDMHMISKHTSVDVVGDDSEAVCDLLR